MANYNSLKDEHLADYFNNPNIIKHLWKMGLLTKDGQIVSEGTFKRNAAQMDHKVRTKDLLADSILRTAVEMEVRAFIIL